MRCWLAVIAQRARPDEAAMAVGVVGELAAAGEKAAVYPVHIVSGRIANRPGTGVGQSGSAGGGA